jgi:N-acyl-phosphatidylethanolamine-hydrolysing phospholipase D
VSGAGRYGLVLLLAGLACCAAGPGEQGPSHHEQEGFRNPYIERRETSPFAYWRMRWFGDVEFPDPEEAKGKIPVVAADLERIRQPAGPPQVTWIGHATVLLQYRGINVLTTRSSRAGSRLFAGPAAHPAGAHPGSSRIDFVVISTTTTITSTGRASRPRRRPALAGAAGAEGVVAERDRPGPVEEFDWWQERRFGELTVTATPVQHWSARSPWDRYETLWAGWALRISDFSAWFTGDTGYNEHQFREIGERLGPFDLALLPIGAYAPRWFMQEVHINPEEAVLIHRDVRARHSIGIQWGGFILTAEPVDEPPRELAAARRKHGIAESEFETLKVGETRVLGVGR